MGCTTSKASWEAARLQRRDDELEALFQQLKEVFPGAHREHYFPPGMGRSWSFRMLEMDFDLVTDYKARCARMISAMEHGSMLSEDHDVAPRDRKSLLSRVRRRYGLLEGEQMTEDYIRHRPQDMEWIYISSESDTE